MIFYLLGKLIKSNLIVLIELEEVADILGIQESLKALK